MSFNLFSSKATMTAMLCWVRLGFVGEGVQILINGIEVNGSDPGWVHDLVGRVGQLKLPHTLYI